MKTYVLTVTEDVAQVIINSLAERPFREVAKTISAIQNQIQIQNKTPEPVLNSATNSAADNYIKGLNLSTTQPAPVVAKPATWFSNATNYIKNLFK